MGVFFNTDGNLRRRAAEGWCVPALQPLQDTGMPCTVSKDCQSGYCHYSSGSKDLPTNQTPVDTKDLLAVAATIGVCQQACAIPGNTPHCEPLGRYSFGIEKPQ